MIEKCFNITLSHKLPNGDIISVYFGTTANISDEYSLDGANKLFSNVYKSTISDIKNKIKKDKLIKAAYTGIIKGIKIHETEEEALIELEKL